MSEPLQQAATSTQHHPYEGSSSPNAGWGPVGPVLGVLAVILVLGAAAVAVGRLCSGKKVFGYGQYDLEGWMETKCASCIDGSIDPPSLPTRRGEGPINAGVPIVVPVEMQAASNTATREGGESQVRMGEP